MKQKITMLLLFIGLNTIAQIKFEKGYFISNNGIKTECFIKNEDWLNNPNKFQYKTTLNSKVLTATIEKIKEFKISNKLYYIRYNVLIDESSSVMGQLSDKRTSDFTEKKLFLKLLVDGKSKLYSYAKKNLIRYFYKKNNGAKQLEYKLYTISQVQIAKNINYIKQLNDFFPCQNINTQKIKYKKADLIRYFEIYNNNCSKNNISQVSTYNRKGKLNIIAKLGYNLSNMKTIINTSPKLNFNAESSFKISFEIEYVMSFNNNKWAYFSEFSYNTFTSTDKSKIGFTGSLDRIYNVDYKYLEIPIGVRHFFFLNKKSKLFIDGGFTFNFPLNSTIDSKLASNTNPTSGSYILDLKRGPLFNFFFMSLGYELKDKYRLEIKYHSPRNMKAVFNNELVHLNLNYQNVSIALGYNLF